MRKLVSCFLSAVILFAVMTSVQAEHQFNRSYTEENLNQIAFPIGGIGTGMYCLEGTGAISHMSVKHHMERYHEPTCFAAICIKGETEEQNVARVVEGPVPDWKFFSIGGAGTGSGGRTYGLPRFKTCRFTERFPFCNIELTDSDLPISAVVTGFSPFIPTCADRSSLPAGSIDYTFTNQSDKELDTVFSFNTRNFMGNRGVGAFPDGFRLLSAEGEFAFAAQVIDKNVTQQKPSVAVDHCWFRGGWFDSLTVAWDNVLKGRVVNNPPVAGNVPGASLFVPLQFKPGETKTVRLYTCWYVPKSGLKNQRGPKPTAHSSAVSMPMDNAPAIGTAKRQQPVTGYMGERLVNTYYPDGDQHTGIIRSPKFKIEKKYIHFLVGGGIDEEECVALVVNGKRKKMTHGLDLEHLRWASWDVESLKGQEAHIEIIDILTGPWGHINADEFLFSDKAICDINVTNLDKDSQTVVFEDFENDNYGSWTVEQVQAKKYEPNTAQADVPDTYVPWYATQFKSVDEVMTAFRSQYDSLRVDSEKFAKVLEESTLPPEIMEAVKANLTIIKSPTVLRQHDGRLWGWEGNHDNGGSCWGTTTHVWNYTQSICHLFPDLERSFRQTEFNESLTPTGHQAFRSSLPVVPNGIEWDASDGQLGTIIRMYREWRISGDDEWIKSYWSKILLSLNYCISRWDPDETGLLQLTHLNTYDVSYQGPESHCSSFYLGALTAVIKMGEYLGEDVDRYKEILERGKKAMKEQLYNGEYFIQLIKNVTIDGQSSQRYGQSVSPDGQSEYYKAVAQAINAQGPKYQYGTGCLSDGVLGFWMTLVAGIDEPILDPKLVHSHLCSVWKYNLKRDLSGHSNTQRPSYAIGNDGGLLLCSWPKGNKPLIPFPYSDEVWTGIEYQVASHLMFMDEKEKGLEIVRICRNRYDGKRRNPFNEYECGHWYARAMSSFGLLQGYTGVRYDAVDKALYFDPTITQTVPLFTATGFGVVRIQNGQASVETRFGKIPVKEYRPLNKYGSSDKLVPSSQNE